MKDLTTGNEGKLIFNFAVPMLIGNLFQQSYNIIDSVIVGNYIGKQALAAIGASFPLIFMLISLVIGIAMGFSVVVSQYYGAKDFYSIRRAIDTMNIFLFFASVALTAIGIIFSRDIFILMKLPPDVLPLAVKYFDLYLCGFVIYFGFNSASAILRGLGDSKTPLYFLIVATILNIAFDFLFIVVMKVGIIGAAMATICSQGLAFLSIIIYLNRYHKLVHFGIKNLVFDKEIFKKTLRIGLPSGFQQTFVALGQMALFGIVNTFGTNVAAGYSAAIRIDSFAALPAMNFSAALSTFVGQNLGAGKPGRVKKGLLATLGMTTIVSVFVSVIVIIFAHPLMQMFNPDLDVIAIGTEYLVIVCSFYLLFTTMFIFTGALRGAGDTLIPMFITLFSLWIVRIPLAYFLSQKIGIDGVWWSVPVAWAIGMTFCIAYYLTGRWKRKVIVKPVLH